MKQWCVLSWWRWLGAKSVDEVVGGWRCIEACIMLFLEAALWQWVGRPHALPHGMFYGGTGSASDISAASARAVVAGWCRFMRLLLSTIAGHVLGNCASPIRRLPDRAP
jgi:hypothetical protein